MATQANPFDVGSGNVSNGIIGGVLTDATDTKAAQYTAQQREVNRPTETVAGQLETILGKDSPLLQFARTRAAQDMNARGLLNSSMAQGAGVAAMIDKATPIAQQDALTYGNRTTENQRAVNESGALNAGEQNKFGLQLGQQRFTASENETQRKFQTSERTAGQAFTAEQTKATQDFQAAQANLDRAQQNALADKSIEAQQALQAAQQAFQAAQSALDRSNQKALQESQQAFTATQNNLDRQQQFQLQVAAQSFQASEAEKNRAAEIMLADKQITAAQALEMARQSFQAQQAGLDRAQAVSLARESQAFQASQGEKDRAQAIMLADKQITAAAALEKARQSFQAEQAGLDRTQQATLQAAQQKFQQSQAELDRAQQVALADKSIAAQQALETARQNFQAAQADLDRSQQSSLQQNSIAAQQSLQTSQQTFQAEQAAQDRAQQTSLANLQIQAQQALQTAQQSFQSAQAELDRAQQVALADKSIAAQQALETARQTFQAAQADLDRAQQVTLQQNQQSFQSIQASLDRSQQEAMTRLTASLNQGAVSSAFAANLSTGTLNTIMSLQADANLSGTADGYIGSDGKYVSNADQSSWPAGVTASSPKSRAIQNAIDSANAVMQWGSTFYGVTLPTLAAPGQTAGTVTPAPGVPNTGAPEPAPETVARYEQLVKDAYASVGRSGIGSDPSQISQAGFDYWLNQLKSGAITEAQFNSIFDQSVTDFVNANPDNPIAKYINDYRNPVSIMPVTPPGGLIESGMAST